MNKLDFKIAQRTFLKGKWYNFLNIAGLALGLAAFIFVALYVDHETSYDQWNKNIDRIFLVELALPNGPSPYTPGGLAGEIKEQCPEVEEVGRMNTALFQIPFYTPTGRFLIKKWVGADYSIARILGIEPKGFKLDPNSDVPAMLLSKQTAEALFPGEGAVLNKTVNMISKSGMPVTIAGVVEDFPGNTNLQFDCIGFSGDITSGKDQSYANQIYQTYVLVRPGTDIGLLSRKIDNIYKKAAFADSSEVARKAVARSGPAIYLDPLRNLHLKPRYGSQANNHIVQGLKLLAVIILIVTGVNFTGLYISQANKRAKEVGIKKVNGIARRQIALQFLLEIFLQCVIALIIAVGVVLIGLPYFNQLLGVDLLISGINLTILGQLSVALVLLTLVAGIYPSVIMAGVIPADVLRGNQLSKGGKLSWISRSITLLQFTFALSFVITLVVINQQVTFMRAQNTGFKAEEVVYIDNLGIYNSPEKFESVRNRIKAIPGVKNVTVASNIPGGIIPASHEFQAGGKAMSLNTIAVDYEYFETLNIEVAEGKVFSATFPGDSLNAVVNEAAARLMDVEEPVGTSIDGCGGRYRIVGVIKDVKEHGFEQHVPPTIYLMNGQCGVSKTQIMISAEDHAIPGMLKALDRDWRNINTLDGDNFNYHFLDALYGRLFEKQERLRTLLIFFSGLAVFIATLGLFSCAAHSLKLRMKEVAIRKVFGARDGQLTVTLSKPFFRMLLLANLIAWPISFIASTKWLQTFAYRVDISVYPFAVALIVSAFIVGLTVCLQIARAVRVNPAVKLKA